MGSIKKVSWVLSGLSVVLLSIGVGGCTGGGDTVISGLGNSGNVIGAAGIPELVAKELAEINATPKVTDEEIAASFTAIRARAMQGDAESALVLLRIAAHQRTPKD